MTRNEWDDDDQQQDTPLVKDLRKQLREATKARDDALAEVTTLKGVTRGTTLKQVLESKKLNPKIATFYPSDGEVTPEAVDAWVKEYADVFGIQTEAPADDSPAGEPSLSPADAAAYQRMVAADAVPAPGSAKEQDMLAKIAAASSPEELQKLMSGQV